MITELFNTARAAIAPDSRLTTSRFFKQQSIVYPVVDDILWGVRRYNVPANYLTSAWGEAVKQRDDQYIVKLYERDKHNGNFQGNTKRTGTVMIEGENRQLLTKEEAIRALEDYETRLAANGYYIDEKQPQKALHFSRFVP